MLPLRLFTAVLPFLFLTIACSPTEERSLGQTGQADGQNEFLADGIYSVLDVAEMPDTVARRYPDAVILMNDGRYFAGGDSSIQYVALDTTSWVPLIIEGAPHRDRDGRGHTSLSATLDHRYVGLLEEFTTRHLNERVATVIGGEAVTVHRIRAVITGGRLMITRCEDDACEVLYTRLTKDNSAS